MKKDAEDVSLEIHIFQRHLECEIRQNRLDQQYFADLLKTRSLRQKFLTFCNTTEAQQPMKRHGFPAMKNSNCSIASMLCRK